MNKSRLAWILVALLALVAFGLRLRGISHGLPMVLEQDCKIPRQVELLQPNAHIGHDLLQQVRPEAHDLAVLDIFEGREGRLGRHRDGSRLFDPVEILGHRARRRQQG